MFERSHMISSDFAPYEFCLYLEDPQTFDEIRNQFVSDLISSECLSHALLKCLGITSIDPRYPKSLEIMRLNHEMTARYLYKAVEDFFVIRIDLSEELGYIHPLGLVNFIRAEQEKEPELKNFLSELTATTTP